MPITDSRSSCVVEVFIFVVSSNTGLVSFPEPGHLSGYAAVLPSSGLCTGGRTEIVGHTTISKGNQEEMENMSSRRKGDEMSRRPKKYGMWSESCPLLR